MRWVTRLLANRKSCKLLRSYKFEGNEPTKLLCCKLNVVKADIRLFVPPNGMKWRGVEEDRVHIVKKCRVVNACNS